MKKLLATCLLALTCCAAAPMEPDVEPVDAISITLHGDTEFTPMERDALRLAAEVWRIQTGGLANINIIYDLDFDDVQSLRRYAWEHTLVRMPSESDQVISMDCSARKDCRPSVLAWVKQPGKDDQYVRMFLIHDRLKTQDARKQVALHEFGHVLGLGHTQDQKSIMYPTYQPRDFCLKEADMKAFCAAHEGCKHVETYWCR